MTTVDPVKAAEAREKNLARLRKWREENPERNREAQRRYRKEHPEVGRAARKRYREKYPEREREQRRKRKPSPPIPGAQMRRAHGKNWEAMFAAFWAAQDGCCYLCGDPLNQETPQAVVVDHDHSCCQQRRSCEICRRGLACGRCNKLVGLANENAARLRRIADALDTANALVRSREAGVMTQAAMF